MGLFSRLKFWEKEKSLTDFELPGAKEAFPGLQEEKFGRGFEEPESYEKLGTPYQPQFQQQMAHPPGSSSRDTDLILAKLDAIKANVESINHRLEVLERLAKE